MESKEWIVELLEKMTDKEICELCKNILIGEVIRETRVGKQIIKDFQDAREIVAKISKAILQVKEEEENGRE